MNNMPAIILRGGFFDRKVLNLTHAEASRPYIEVLDNTSSPFTIYVYKKIQLIDGGYIWCDNENIDVEVDKYNRSLALCRGSY
jgi:hypothetical protein